MPNHLLRSGLCRCTREPHFDCGMEGYNLGSAYHFQRRRNARGSYVRVYHDHSYYETTGPDLFQKHFEEITMPTLIVMVGLPRSGKTTWAKEYSASHNCPIVNPDSVRLAIHGQRFVLSAEGFVWATVRAMVKALFLAGHDQVLIDATNVTRKRRQEWVSKDWQTFYQFIDTPKAECLRRAALANDAEIVPVIERMDAEFEMLGHDEGRVE